MTKVCIDDFKKEDYPPGKLRSDGFSIHEWLKENYDVCIKAVHKDLDFVFIVSGNGFVRVGKSLVAMQGGYYITKAVNQMYGLKNTFNLEENYAYNANELIRKAMKLPKYSVIILDEGDDLEENYWSYLAKVLRRFFRKCGQKNLFIFMVVPDFFELKKAYAITRSIALINVKFEGEFERGNFQFF